MILGLSLALTALAQAPSTHGSAEPHADEGEGTVEESQLEELLTGEPSSNKRGSRKYVEEDFSAYFASGDHALARRAFGARQYSRAIRLLSGDSLPARYLRALAAFHARKDRVAAHEFGVLAGEYPALRDHCLLHAARAYERLRNPHAAIALYDAVAPASSLYPEARFRLARVLERRLALEEALEALRPLRDLPSLPRHQAVRRRALMHIIRLDQARGDYRDEHRASLELWATSPLSREAQAVLERLRQLPIPNKWRVRRAQTLLSLHHNEGAMRLARQVKTQLPDEDACRAAFVVGNALRKERRHRAAIAALNPVVESCTQSEVRPQALYVLGYSQSVVDPVSGVLTYEALARDYPGHPFADDALFFASELHASAGQTGRAMERLEQVAQRYPEGNFSAEALFRLGWLQRRAGALEAAVKTLTRLAMRPGLEREPLLRARYWTARLLEEKDRRRRPELFLAITREHPASWYGLLARAALPEELAVSTSLPGAPCDASNTRCAAPSLWPLEAGPLATEVNFLAGVELLRMGLPEGARVLTQVERRGLPPEAARLLMEVLDLAGRERSAGSLARSALAEHLSGGVDGQTQKVWEALYPLPFRKYVEKYAARAGVEANLVWALMREESRFRPRARSATGALGLTQVMPRTARQVARTLRIRGLRDRWLLRPDLNIRLGASYLGSLVEELGSVPLAVAAYNAGPRAVRRWLEARPDAPLDAFVEEIPFAETRGYVKRVLASYAAYQLVYGAGAPPLQCLGLTGRAGQVAARCERPERAARR